MMAEQGAPVGARASRSRDLVFEYLFEGDMVELDEVFHKHGGCYDYSFKLVRSPEPPAASKVVQLTNIMGQDNMNCTGNFKENKHRVELMPRDPKTRAEPDEEIWAGFRFMFGRDWPSENRVDFLVCQIIPDPWDGTDFQFRITPSGQLFCEARKSPAEVKPRDKCQKKVGDAEFGVWTDFVMRYKRSMNNKGVAQVWLNGELKFDYEGVTSQSNSQGGLWKFGLYHSPVPRHDQLGQNYKAYFDACRIAKGPNHFDDVKPVEL